MATKTHTRTAQLDRDTGTLTITQDGNRKVYRVEELDSEPEIGAPAFHLTLESDPSNGYDIILTSSGWECTCADWTFRHRNDGQPCKHLGALKATGVIR